MTKKLCSICDEGRRKKNTKDGYICKSCLSMLPLGVRNNIDKFTNSDIKKLVEIFNEKFELERIYSKNHIVIKDTHMNINGFNYKYSNIESVKLVNRIAEPEPVDYGRRVKCQLNIIVTLKNPHVLIEETLYTDEFEYFINQDRISFQMTELENNMIHNLFFNFINSEFSSYYEFRKANHKQSNENNTNKTKQNKETPDEKRLKAEKLYRLTAPYTKSDVKKARNNLLKFFHSDAGGDDEITQRIYDAYEILTKAATN